MADSLDRVTNAIKKASREYGVNEIMGAVHGAFLDLGDEARKRGTTLRDEPDSPFGSARFWDEMARIQRDQMEAVDGLMEDAAYGWD